MFFTKIYLVDSFSEDARKNPAECDLIIMSLGLIAISDSTPSTGFLVFIASITSLSFTKHNLEEKIKMIHGKE